MLKFNFSIKRGLKKCVSQVLSVVMCVAFCFIDSISVFAEKEDICFDDNWSSYGPTINGWSFFADEATSDYFGSNKHVAKVKKVNQPLKVIHRSPTHYYEFYSTGYIWNNGDWYFVSGNYKKDDAETTNRVILLAGKYTETAITASGIWSKYSTPCEYGNPVKDAGQWDANFPSSYIFILSNIESDPTKWNIPALSLAAKSVAEAELTTEAAKADTDKDELISALEASFVDAKNYLYADRNKEKIENIITKIGDDGYSINKDATMKLVNEIVPATKADIYNLEDEFSKTIGTKVSQSEFNVLKDAVNNTKTGLATKASKTDLENLKKWTQNELNKKQSAQTEADLCKKEMDNTTLSIRGRSNPYIGTNVKVYGYVQYLYMCQYKAGHDYEYISQLKGYTGKSGDFVRNTNNAVICSWIYVGNKKEDFYHGKTLSEVIADLKSRYSNYEDAIVKATGSIENETSTNPILIAKSPVIKLQDDVLATAENNDANAEDEVEYVYLNVEQLSSVLESTNTYKKIDELENSTSEINNAINDLQSDYDAKLLDIITKNNENNEQNNKRFSDLEKKLNNLLNYISGMKRKTPFFGSYLFK